MYAVVILLLHLISFIKHSDDPLQGFIYGYRTYRKKEIYCLMGCDTIYPGNLISLFMPLCFDGKSVKSV
jgi:hypothetical protein